MLKFLSTSVVLLLMTFNAFAGNASVYNAKLTETLKKYEFMLTSHENADSADFKAKVLADMKTEITAATKNASKEEIKSTFDALIAKIPSELKRESYKELIQNSSKKDLEKLLSNPSFLEDTFRGESSNYTGTQFAETLLYTVGAALILWLVVAAIEEAANYQTFYSFTVYYEKDAFFSTGCYSSDLTIYTEEALISDALDKCERLANNPSTCDFRGFSISESYDSYWDEYQCRARAKVRAAK